MSKMIFTVHEGRRSGDTAELVKSDKFYRDNMCVAMVVLRFPDGETFGYQSSQVSGKAS